jgi:hypothetical protein
MIYAKVHGYIFIIMAFFLQQAKIFAMKEENKTRKLNPHTLELKNYLDKNEGLLISDSITIFETKQSYLLAVAIDVKIIAFLVDFHTIKIFNIESGCCLNTFNSNDREIYTIQKITSTSIAIGNIKGEVIIWNFNNNKKKLFKNHETPIFRIIKMTKKTIIAAHDDNIVEFFDIENEICIKTISIAPYDFIERLSDTKLISGKKNKNFIVIWNLKDGEGNGYGVGKKEDNYTIMCLLKNSENSGAFCYQEPEKKNTAFIVVFNSDSNQMIQKFDAESIPIFMLHISSKNALIILDKKDTISLWSLQNPAVKIQSLFCLDFLEKNSDSIISIRYLEKKNIIMIITKKGCVITCYCKI